MQRWITLLFLMASICAASCQPTTSQQTQALLHLKEHLLVQKGTTNLLSWSAGNGDACGAAHDAGNAWEGVICSPSLLIQEL
jgi:Leucine rich repeat N-terminal domain